MMQHRAMRVLLLFPPVALVGLSVVAGAPATAASVVLVALYSAAYLARWWPGFLVASLSCTLALPLFAAPYLASWAVLAGLFALPAVGHGFSRLAGPALEVMGSTGRSLSPLCGSIMASLVGVAVLAVVAAANVVALAAVMILSAFAVGAAVGYVRLGRTPLAVDVREMSLRAGTRLDLEVEVRWSRGRAGGPVSMAATGGATLRGPQWFVPGHGAALTVSFVPTLGGPASIIVHGVASDAFGLVRIGQRLEVARLNVIPRARIARWAAAEYLEHRGGVGEWHGVLSGEVSYVLGSLTGAEYVASRMYVPGDSPKSIDWKHTAKLGSLVVKVFEDSAKSPGAVVVNLSVGDAEEADRLVYELLSAALTVAALSHRASFVVYGGTSTDGRTTPVLGGDDVVRAALEACAGVVAAPVAWRRWLRPASLQEVQKQVARARRIAGDGSALVSLLETKEHATRVAVEREPVGALVRTEATRDHPAWCVGISAMRGDAEALLTVLREMEHGEVRTRLVDVSSTSLGHTVRRSDEDIVGRKAYGTRRHGRGTMYRGGSAQRDWSEAG
jgi:uncharacterized protein (DUF58 family)